MKAARFLMVACGLLGIFMGCAQAQQAASTDTFELAFCNNSDYASMSLALMYKKDAQNWEVSGWYPIPDSGCTIVGRFIRDIIYYFAFSGEGAVWRAPDNDQTASIQCVDYNKWFKAVGAGVPTCPAGQQSVRFKMVTVPANTARRTWTLTGSKPAKP
jgi:uncharacterized membrane protein